MSRSFVGSSRTSTFDGLREELREQEPVPLPARQDLHRASRAGRREQEILEIADDMTAVAVDGHVIAAEGNVVLNGFLIVELGPVLVEIGHFEVRSVFYRALLRRQLVQQDFEQRRLPRPVRPDNADLVAPDDGRGKITDDGAAAETMADVGRFDDQLARALRFLHLHARRARHLPALAPDLPQLLERPHTAFVPRPPAP